MAADRIAEFATSRFSLRAWREDDLAPFAALNADPEVMRHFPAPLTREQSDASARRIMAAMARDGYGLWALDVPGIGFAGFVGLQHVPFEARFTPAVEVGWRLARAAWGSGLATDGARLALAHAFGPLGVSEVVSFTVPDNLRSRAVMVRLGMRPDGEFEHPRLPVGHAQRRHVLYRIAATPPLGQNASGYGLPG